MSKSIFNNVREKLHRHGLYIMLGFLIAMLCVITILSFMAISEKMGKSDEKETDWRDFVQNYLSKSMVDRIEVISEVNRKGYRALVYLVVDRENKTDNVNQSLFKNMISATDANRSEIVTEEISMQSSSKMDLENKKLVFFFNCVKTFERNLEMIQIDMGIERINFVSVIYKNQTKGYEVLMFTMLLLLMIVTFIIAIFSGRSACEIIRPSDIKTKFRDIAGCEHAKIEVMEFVNFFKNPVLYSKLGAKIPKGVILYGPPGMGKTLLAKAVAAEAGVAFIHMAGSEFDEKLVGVGASRIRKLFEKARNNSPCIIFIDEIDAIGSKRSDKHPFTHYQTLNQLLVEMDGFDTTDDVVVMAATNRIELLDPALIRAGRFDRKISFDMPNTKARAEIFQIHLSGLTTNLDKLELSKKLAVTTVGMSGADIATICNESSLLAARDLSPSITSIHFEEAVQRVLSGINKKMVLQFEERKVIAYHESGHAVTAWFLEFANPLCSVSIISRGKALGYTQELPNENDLSTKGKLIDKICCLLGGRASEEIFFDRITAGCTDDLKKATELVHTIITEYGMNDKVGLLNYDFNIENDTPMLKLLSNETMNLIDIEVREVLLFAYKRTMHLLQDHKKDIEILAESLLQKNVLCRDEIIRLLGPRPFKEKVTYESIVDDTFEECTTLPKSLDHFNASNGESEIVAKAAPMNQDVNLNEM